MESRGVYMSSDMATSKVYADGILKFNKQIAKVVEASRIRAHVDQFFERLSA
jgi:hypothetical protein